MGRDGVGSYCFLRWVFGRWVVRVVMDIGSVDGVGWDFRFVGLEGCSGGAGT